MQGILQQRPNNVANEEAHESFGVGVGWNGGYVREWEDWVREEVG